MIDVIINEAGGLTVAHDDKSLDGFEALAIGRADGAAVLTGAAGERRIGTLKPAMLEMLREAMPGRMIRMSGWSLARISPLSVRVHA